MLTVVILTRDEERHIARAISSVAGIADRILVVDSGSSDRTAEIAKGLGAEVLHNAWRNYATQFNWALDRLPDSTQWIMRLDADEIVSPELAVQIAATLPRLGPEVEGIVVGRRMAFMGRVIRHGGLFPIRVVRIFRHGKGRCENRWMDEHVIVRGAVCDLPGELLDDNLNSLTWWTEKHNSYASREVVDLLNLEYGFMASDRTADMCTGQARTKRWLKERVYARLPGGLRAFAYFLYRYVMRGGFLDGREGLAFHVLQGFWYRFLVDMKLQEVRRLMRSHDIDIATAIRRVLNIEVATQ
ncbi:glycosyltransferase family 2 protein [Cereibacter azotoformans]|uniref:Glycosyltransferase involved in cell wall biosynthesis n=1 Tax=Cereibacter azotoformans TaxID=43057 RepID=A0A2T5JSP2_9RHOB|nr:glycosyltransferase family 2 protein [Cereibacter azotoformans]PTR11621.1 glycosyltransferase involved in cell wall biosynthesis [Cereibacter azotoformans]